MFFKPRPPFQQSRPALSQSSGTGGTERLPMQNTADVGRAYPVYFGLGVR